LNYWLAKDFINPNWWWNEINVPTSFGEIAFLLKAFLDSTQIYLLIFLIFSRLLIFSIFSPLFSHLLFSLIFFSYFPLSYSLSFSSSSSFDKRHIRECDDNESSQLEWVDWREFGLDG
jgi:hypothetical protein